MASLRPLPWLKRHLAGCFELLQLFTKESWKGLYACGRGMLSVARPQAMEPCLSSILKILPAVAAVSVGLWVICFPFTQMGWLTFTWRDALRASSALALEVDRLLLSHHSRKVFYTVLDAEDPAIAAEIKSMKVINGIRAQMFSLAKNVVVGVVVAVVVICMSPILLPVLVGLGINAWILLLLVVLGMCLAGAVTGKWYEAFAPFMKIFVKVDPLVGIMVIVAAALKAFHGVSVSALMKTCSIFFYSSRVLTKQLLANYSERLDTKEWTGFVKKHRWSISGFGLPAFLLTNYLPEAAVLLLPAFHGAAACLLAQCLQDDRRKGS